MNVHRDKSSGVIANMEKLAAWDFDVIEPGEGNLACGYVGKGRLEETQTIIEVIKNHQINESLLQGKKVLISAGPTREVIDPVRFFTNRSTGKMGFTLAEAAAQFGADVTLVSGPVQLQTTHPNITRIDVESAEDM